MLTVSNTREMREVLSLARGPFSYIKQNWMGASGKRSHCMELGTCPVDSQYLRLYLGARNA